MLSAGARLGRGRFWLATLVAWGVFWTLYAATEGLGGSALPDVTRVPAALLILILGGLCVRRCHDLDQSAWRLLVLLVPVFGIVLVCFELGLRRGTVGLNRFGADPADRRAPDPRAYATVGDRDR